MPERQERLPFSSSRTGLLAYASKREKFIIMLLGGLILVSVVIYVSSIIASVIHVANREEYAQKSQNLGATLSDLERNYLFRSDSLTAPYAKSVGFRSVESHTYIERGSAFTLRP